MSTQITTGKVRFSYCNLFTPRAAQEGAKEKYSVTLLIPKSDKATIQKIKTAMEEAKAARSCRPTSRAPCTTATVSVPTVASSVRSVRAATLSLSAPTISRSWCTRIKPL